MAKRKYTKKAVVTPVVTPTESVFTASLNLKTLRQNLTATGASVSEAIGNLKPDNARGVSILTLTKGAKTKERILQPFTTQRLFNSQGITRDIFLKNAVLLFQGFDQ